MGYALNNPQVEVEKELEPKKSKDPLDQSYIELEEFPDSFLDSLLDFDGWLESNSNPSMADVIDNLELKPNLDILDKFLEVKQEVEGEECGSVKLGDVGQLGVDVIDNKKEKSNSENMDVSLEREKAKESVKLGDLGCLIEEGMGRVSLTPNTNGEVMVGDEKGNGNDVTPSGKNGDVNSYDVKVTDKEGNDGDVVGVVNSVKNGCMEKKGEDGDATAVVELDEDSEESESELDESEESESELESESSNSSSSSSSDDDDDEDESDEECKGKGKMKLKGELEMEEGEIRDMDVEEMVSWSDDEEPKGPIRSKNEVQNLPPVPPVNATIEPHHQTLPVGVVLSIIGAQVIVEGVEKHNPLSEGSILWITESRAPLGIVDEIFGPVKNPYYIVRYNSESEVPSGIQQGSLISFVPEFADYVLNNNNLYKKGYDASGENDEEFSDGVEFSDDEKEAEYKKMLEASKRGSNEQKNGNMRKGKKSRNRVGNWKNNQQPSPASQTDSPVGPSEPRLNQAFSQGSQAANFNGPSSSSGVWTNGFQPVPPQNMNFPPNGFPPFMQQNFTPQPFQNLALMNSIPFPQQFNTSGPMMSPNFVLQGIPPNFGPMMLPWPQNGFKPPQLGSPMAFQGLYSNPNALQIQNNNGFRPLMPSDVQNQNNTDMRLLMANGLQMQSNNDMRPPMSNGLQMENNGGSRPSFVAGNGEDSQNPKQGNGFSNRGGKKPFQRGGGWFRGGGRGRRGRGGGGRTGGSGQQSR